ncbi:MAG TPA: MoxR family ATPase [Pirellulales bacterium]|nr:MoxR family ATPase [Pirellulales bacterium]
MSDPSNDPDLAGLAKLKDAHQSLRTQIARIVVGQDEVLDQLMISIFARGHCMLEGVPGLAKTLMVSTLADCLSLNFNRIQFTPDLMPSDITGTEVLQEDRSTGARQLRYVHGPIFANVVLADEINRTPPKTQAALLEAMQERQVSAGGQRYPLPDPFFVLATQNPIEQEGTYPLPEAQLDRFLFKVYVGYPSRDEERQIYRLTTGMQTQQVAKVLSGEEIPALQALVRRVPVSDHCLDFAMALVRATRVGEAEAEGPQYVSKWIAWGAGPRAGQALVLASKARAALDGRTSVTIEDIRAMAPPVLRHRLVTTYAAQAEGQTPDTIIHRLLQDIPERAGAARADGQVAHVFQS